jgi:hypothetical protein
MAEDGMGELHFCDFLAEHYYSALLKDIYVRAKHFNPYIQHLKTLLECFAPGDIGGLGNPFVGGRLCPTRYIT